MPLLPLDPRRIQFTPTETNSQISLVHYTLMVQIVKAGIQVYK